MGFEAALPPALMHEVSEQKDPSPGVKENLPTMAQASAGQGLETPRAPRHSTVCSMFQGKSPWLLLYRSHRRPWQWAKHD